MRRPVTHLTNATLAAGGAITLGVLVHDVYAYGWMGWRQFTASAAWPEQLALALVGALLFASLRLRPTFRTAVAAVFVFLVVVLYAGELVLAGSVRARTRVAFWGFVPANSREELATVARGFGVQIDTRNPTEVRDDLRAQGIDAVPAVMIGGIVAGGGLRAGESPNEQALVPLGGIANKVTVLCNESGQYVRYTSDEHGFRNPGGVWNRARADMAVVGESFVQGACVPDGQGFVDLLRTHFPVTLNLGVSGQTALLQLAAIKEYLPRYAPKVVLWVFCENIDRYDVEGELMNPVAMQYMEPGFTQRLLARQPEIDRALQRFVAAEEARARTPKPTITGRAVREQLWEEIKLSELRRQLDLLYGIKSGAFAREWSLLDQKRDRLLSDTLRQARTITDSWGGALYVVYLPSSTRYRNGPLASEGEHTKVVQLVRALGIPVIDVEPDFRAQQDPLSLFPFRRFGHYTEAGNQLVADAILRFVAVRE